MIPRTLPPVHSPISLGALRHGWRGLLGDATPALAGVRELLLRQYVGRDVLLTDSGTTALALALCLAVTLRPECPRVALPAWACYDLATAADAADVGVVLYDLDPATLGPDGSSLDRTLAAGVAAVVVVHAYGLPVNLPEVVSRATQAGALVIEDAAQAVGATLGARRAGASGALGVLSFGRGKGWTGGGGGALLLSSGAPSELILPEDRVLVRGRRGVGAVVKLMAQWLLARPVLYALPSALPFLQLGETVYHLPSQPARMSGAEAALVLATAPLQDREADRRRAHAERLRRAAEVGGAGSTPLGWTGGQPGWLRLPLLPTDATLRRASNPASRRLGILPGYPMLLARLPGFAARLHGAVSAYPGAEELALRLHTLPTHGQLTPADLGKLERWLAGA